MQSTNTIKKTEPEELTQLTEETVIRLSKAKGEPDWLLQARLEAFGQLENLAMPQLTYGLHVSSALDMDERQLKPLTSITSHGSKEENGVVVEDLSVAASKYEAVLKPLLIGKYGKAAFQNRMEALHAAFWNNGLFIYARKGAKAGKAAISLAQKQTEIVHVVVVAEEDSTLEVVETITSDSLDSSDGNTKKDCRIEVINVTARPGSVVRFATVQKLGTNVNSLMSRNAYADTRASVDWVDAGIGGQNTKQEIVSMLNGEGAATNIFGAFFGEGAQKLDIMTKAVHNARNTTSNMKIKGALKGRARVIAQSFTKIMGTAPNSEGHQKANVLLLSDSARASPIPKLEIDNYDVKASHEASVGQLDKEKLFYMMSRGVGEKEAVRLVVEGFFEPLLKQMPFEELAEDLRHTIRAKMEDAGEELLKNA
ncbi:SufD family Fe-S cluster assembly protein [Candidatus Woesearchaeota archaeon]|nr:SufD family Fe-S cluster assembly protein [Candidatus Woesearchaeota archaeon]